MIYNEEKYKTLVHTIPDIIYEIDVDGKFIFLNEAVRFLGYKPSELVGKHFSRIIHPEDLKRVSRANVLPLYIGKITGDANSPKLFDERRTNERMTRNLELRLLHKDPHGEPVRFCYAEVSSSGKWECPIKDIDKKLIGSIGIIKDITDRKRLDERKNEFVGMVSHELRAPLVITREAVSIVLEEIAGKVNKEQKEILIKAKDSVDRLIRIINDLLDLSKIEAGWVGIKMDHVNVNNLVKTAHAIFETRAKKNNVTFDITLLDKEINFYADFDKILQLLTNLVGNALKFTPSGGHVNISAEKVYNEDLASEVVLISVTDTGKGISKEDIGKVFKKFQQFGDAPANGEKGTGLGLAIAKELVELHHGRIWVESPPENLIKKDISHGTRFSFILPIISFRQLFVECVLMEAKRALRNNSKFSVMSISKLAVSKNSAAKLEQMLKKHLRRSGDIAVVDNNKAAVLLVECNKEGARGVKKRIETTFKWKKPTFKCLTYPDDVVSADELLADIGWGTSSK